MLQNLLAKKNKESGFTIIEVMIVLAIAGLILVVVLIAIPQLQRNQRNTARQNDASRVSTSVSTWMANNSGAIFTAGTGNANLTAVLNDLGGLSQYTLTAGTNFTVGTASTVGTGTIATIDAIRIVTGARCNTSAQGQVTGSGAAARGFAIQYATETSSGTQAQCVAV